MDLSYVISDPTEGLDPENYLQVRRAVQSAIVGRAEVVTTPEDAAAVEAAARKVDAAPLGEPPIKAADLGVDPSALAVMVAREVRQVLKGVTELLEGPIGRVASATELRTEMAWVLVALCSLDNVLEGDCGTCAWGDASESLSYLMGIFPDQECRWT